MHRHRHRHARTRSPTVPERCVQRAALPRRREGTARECSRPLPHAWKSHRGPRHESAQLRDTWGDGQKAGEHVPRGATEGCVTQGGPASQGPSLGWDVQSQKSVTAHAIPTTTVSTGMPRDPCCRQRTGPKAEVARPRLTAGRWWRAKPQPKPVSCPRPGTPRCWLQAERGPGSSSSGGPALGHDRAAFLTSEWPARGLGCPGHERQERRRDGRVRTTRRRRVRLRDSPAWTS